MSLEVLQDGPQPERSYCYRAPCPLHPRGDEARLDYRAEGWPGLCERKNHSSQCVRVWRASILCDELFQVFYCDKGLPEVLRRVTQSSGQNRKVHKVYRN